MAGKIAKNNALHLIKNDPLRAAERLFEREILADFIARMFPASLIETADEENEFIVIEEVEIWPYDYDVLTLANRIIAKGDK